MTNNPELGTPKTYAEAGVDIGAGDELVERIKPFAQATSRPGTAVALGGFGALFDIKAAGYSDPILVASNDGVGTKVKIAIETGRHDTIGIDLVAMCANDVVVQGAAPLFFLDYFASGKLDVDVAARVIRGIAEGCRQAGAALVGGETAEMPDMYAPNDYDLAGFCVGAAERGALLPRPDIKDGDALIGVASNGVHSNGFSLVRKIVRGARLSWSDSAPFDPTKSLGEALLEPTRIYVRAALSVLEGPGAKAFAHITGGGLPGNLPRVLPSHLTAVVDLGAIEPQPVFNWIAAVGGISEAEMLKTFNCGVGFVAVVELAREEHAMAAFAAAGNKAVHLGYLERRAAGLAPIRFEGRLEFG